MHSDKGADRLNGLDTLRATAILLVMMFHYSVFVSDSATFGWLGDLGWAGVDLFFVLSGYLIGDQIFAGLAQQRPLSLVAFYGRRLLRTLPNFYVVLMLYFMFPAFMGGSTPPPLWRFLTFTQNFNVAHDMAFAHAWSLCVEEQFYLVFPLLALVFARTGLPLRGAWTVLSALLVMGIVARFLYWTRYGRIADGMVSDYWTHVYFGSLCRLDEFLPGVGIALLKNFHPTIWAKMLRGGNWCLAAGLLCTALVGVLFLKGNWIPDYGFGLTATVFGYPLLALSFGLLVISAGDPGAIANRIRIPGAKQLAAWSYAIYLSHLPILMIVHRDYMPPLLSG